MTNKLDLNKDFERTTYTRLNRINKIMTKILDEGYKDELDKQNVNRFVYIILDDFKYIIDGKPKITDEGFVIEHERLKETINYFLDDTESKLTKIEKKIEDDKKHNAKINKKFSKYFNCIDSFSELQNKYWEDN